MSRKLRPAPAKSAHRSGAGVAGLRAVHLAAGGVEVRRVGIEPDDAGEAGEDGLVGELVLRP